MLAAMASSPFGSPGNWGWLGQSVNGMVKGGCLPDTSLEKGSKHLKLLSLNFSLGLWTNVYTTPYCNHLEFLELIVEKKLVTNTGVDLNINCHCQDSNIFLLPKWKVGIDVKISRTCCSALSLTSAGR